MPFLSRLASLRRNLFSRQRVERDLDDEMRAYVGELTAEKRAAGMTAADAQRAASLELGGMQQIKEEVRHVKTGQMFEEFLQDIRYGFRTLRKNPAFSVVAIIALALGIGANTAMYSVTYGILLRPLPYRDADRVAMVFMSYFPRDFMYGTLCIRDYLMWKENNHAFEEPSLFTGRLMDISGTGRDPEQVQGVSVTAGTFSTLGVAPLIGRTFLSGDDQPKAGSMAVLSESVWRRRYGGSPAVLAQTIVVNGEPSTVIGVMPAAFQFPNPQTEIWTNLVLTPPTRYGPWFYRGVARLKPGVTMEQARAEMNNIAQRMMQANPYYKRLSLPVRSLRDAVLGTTLKPAILILAGAVGLVLLIAVVNVANLMLARATVREREMALRLSLGAARGRLVRQLLTESVLLAMIGGTAGLALAWGGIKLIRVWNPGNLPFIDAVRLDGHALGFMIVAAVLTGILFGLAPAFQSANADLNSTIKEGGRGSGGSSRSRGRTRSALVVSEIALSLMLLVGAGLLMRSFVKLQQTNAGFSAPPGQILTMLISPGRKYGDSAPGLAFYDEVIRRVRSVPGVEIAALTDSFPPDHQGDADSFGMEGQTLAPGELNPIISTVTVSSDFFHAFRIPMIKGRSFTDHDSEGSTPVAIVSEGFARRFYPGQDAIGKRIRHSGAGSSDPWMEIVGIVGNVKYMGLTTDTDPAYYMPFRQNYLSRSYLIVRTQGDAALAVTEVRRQIRSIDPGVTLSFIVTMEQVMSRTVAQPRFDTMLLGLFAGIAIVLAAVGIYGLIAYAVVQRTHEIGVRMALGASRSDVLRMVAAQGASLAAIGIVVGLAGAFALTRLLKTLLFGVSVTDGITFVAAPLGLMLVVFLATLVPAIRATRTSPVVALRYE